MRRLSLAILVLSIVTASGFSARAEKQVASAPVRGHVPDHHHASVPQPAPVPGKQWPVLHGVFASSSDPITHPTIGGGVGALSADEVAAFARGAGFPESVIPTMVAIAYRESHWIPTAVNLSSGACGLWQMYPCPGIQALDPATNAEMAFAKYQASGLDPWGM